MSPTPCLNRCGLQCSSSQPTLWRTPLVLPSLLGVVLAICTSASAAPPAAIAEPPAAAVKADTRIEVASDDTIRKVGFSPERLAIIAPAMKGFVASRTVTGVVTLVAVDGEIVHHAAVGQAVLAPATPMQGDTLFSIASMTKPITATALMMLVSEGKVDLDAPVATYLPEWADIKMADGSPPPTPVTVRHLITHTSGLTGSQANTGTLAETVAGFARRKLAFAPGTAWQYSPGVSVCGRVVEVVSGQDLATFFDERIFQPLGMHDTSFHPPAEAESRYAPPYRVSAETGELVPAERTWFSSFNAGTTPNPSGGLVSSATDLFRFYQMILDGGEGNGVRLLPAAAVEEMTRPHTGDLTAGFVPGSAWGLGWSIVQEPQGVTALLAPGTYGHGGALGTQGWVDPSRRTISILLISRANLGNSDASDLRRTFHFLTESARLP